MASPILAPGAVLVLWTLIMLAWMGSARFKAIAQSGVDIRATPPGGRGQDLEGILPPEANWKSHNYTHLLEQPTLFYAVILFLHLSGGVTLMTQIFAWTYVGIRIVHSIWQAKFNRISIRMLLFSLSSLCLLALSLLAVIATMG